MFNKEDTMNVTIYTRRVRTATATVSEYTGCLFTPSYRWGYVEGSTKPEWFYSNTVESF